jgi:hypothetical protein
MYGSQGGNYSQSIQLTDNSYPTLYFQMTHNDQDILNKYSSNDFQTRYDGDWSQPGLINHAQAGIDLNNGATSYGQFYSYQLLGGFYNYNFTFQKLRYNVDPKSTDTYTFSFPMPFYVQAIYYDKSDSSKEYNVQKIATFSLGNLQSNNILTYDDTIPSDTEKSAGALEVQTTSLNDFTNYFFSPFIYQQGTFLYTCATSQVCNFNNIGTSFNFQNSMINSKVGYNLIPNQVFLYFQDYFWKISDVTLYYNKTFNPMPFLQNSPITYNSSSDTEGQFYSLVNARLQQGNWLYTLTLPLLYINYMSSAALNVQYNSQSISTFCNFQVLQDLEQNWSHFTWNVSLGFNYYPDFGIKQAINSIRIQKIYGTVYSNTHDPEKDVKVTLFLNNGKILTTKTVESGKYFLEGGIPASGILKIMVEKNGIQNTSEFIKDIDRTVQQEDLEIPLYTFVDVHFYLLNEGNQKESQLLDIENSSMGYSIISAENAVYDQNKIILKREGVVKLKMNRDVLPFHYRFVKMSKSKINTLKKDKLDLNVYLMEKKF